MTRQSDPGDELRDDRPETVIPAADDYAAIKANTERLANDKAAAAAMLRLKDQLQDSEASAPATITSGSIFDQAKPALPVGRSTQSLSDTAGMAGNPLKGVVDEALAKRTYDKLKSGMEGVAPEVRTDPPHVATQEMADLCTDVLDPILNDRINATLDAMSAPVVLGDTRRTVGEQLVRPIGSIQKAQEYNPNQLTVSPIEYGFGIMLQEGARGVVFIREDGKTIQDREARQLIVSCKAARAEDSGAPIELQFRAVAAMLGGWHAAHDSRMVGSLNEAVRKALRGTTDRQLDEAKGRAAMQAAADFERAFGRRGDDAADMPAVCDECGSTNVRGRVEAKGEIEKMERGLAMQMACALNAGLMRKLDDVVSDAERLLEWLQTGV
jgi:hypothetical protein